ncbi:ATP-binding protein [Streptomyces sp. NPDC002845]
MNAETPTETLTEALTETPTVTGEFTQLLSSTRRGARLARRLTTQQLHAWGIPYGSDVSDTAAQIVAELAANAVTHGHVPGRSFLLRLVRETAALRIEVADTRGERRPCVRDLVPDGEAGRGLRIVEALADDWGVIDRAVGKCVWAEVHLR